MSEHAENNAPAASRIVGRPFAKGTTGNAGGRSKTARDIQALAQQHGPAAIQALAQALKSRNERVRVAAAAILLDRGYGKAPQAIVGADGNPVMLLHLFATRAIGEAIVSELAARQSTIIDSHPVNGDMKPPDSLADLSSPATE
jgi:hypothetical protein